MIEFAYHIKLPLLTGLGWRSVSKNAFYFRPDVSKTGFSYEKYVSAEEKHKFAWTKHAVDNCHVHQE